jgi:hypothetical protein
MNDVVFAYTDADALRDGFLVDVRGLARYPINRVTRSVWEAFTRPIGRAGSSPVTDVSALCGLLDEVARRIRTGQLQEGWAVLDWLGRRIWAMPNGTRYGPPPRDGEGWTVMFPEDY